MGQKLKLGVVITGAVIITALGIDAADTLDGNSGTLLGQLAGSDGGACPSGMVESLSPTAKCIDVYEASAGPNCPVATPGSQQESNNNIHASQCAPQSQPSMVPWRFVAREEAAAMCARAGKRLPTAAEWYQSVVGLVDDSGCNIDSDSPAKTGSFSDCRSPSGTYDQIGNVWEWVTDDIIDGKLADRTLPAEGYVDQVDQAGIATLTNFDSPNAAFGKDYFWSSESGAYGIIRGGFYGSEEDAGVYAVHAHTLPTMSGTAIGFRCVR